MYIYIYIISLFYPIIVPYASQVSKNDKLRHLEWLCFDCHAKCLKPWKIHIIWFPTKILDFTVFWWHFPKKTTIETQKWWPFQIILTFLFIHLLPFRRSCYMYETCKNAQIELQHFCSPKKVVPTVFARYNREQLGKYTGKLVVTIDLGIRVWYGMVVYQKDGKTCEGSPLSALQAYNQIISLWFSYYFPSCSLLFPYVSPIVPYCFYYLPIISLLVPYFCPIISLCIYIYIISLFYPIIVPYASQVSKTINLDT